MSLYHYFDGMTWPVPGQPLDDVEATLRYSSRANEAMGAASIVAAYRELIECNRNKRNAVIKEIRKEMKRREP